MRNAFISSPQHPHATDFVAFIFAILFFLKNIVYLGIEHIIKLLDKDLSASFHALNMAGIMLSVRLGI